MNGPPARAMRYAVRHAIAVAVVVCCVAALTVLSYLGLLAWACVTNAPVGGPLALPFMLLVAVAVSAVAAVAVLWPVTAVSEAVRWRARGSGPALQIATAMALLFLEVTSGGLVVALLRNQPAATGLITGAIVSAVLLIPLGIYWWSLRITDWLLGAGEFLFRRLTRQPTPHR